ncbi:MAG: NINE protein [Synechococcales cyanobacterium RU_4_20]|nr:NINE protein [Synechococcales cyanobacterium RU_4_20]NJR70562.1 NINE protein [Synechococcales cyanobacterium CRU_2_2]
MVQSSTFRLKSRKLAAAFALLGVVTLPGIHRFYLGQPRWGLVYVLLAWKTPVSRVASALEAIWYLFLEDEEFDRAFNQLDGVPLESAPTWVNPFRRKLVTLGVDPERVSAIAEALRNLEQLRQEGLMTDAEFEQKRRTMLNQID